MSSQRRSSAVTANNENANGVAGNAKKKVVRESIEVHAPEIAFADCVRVRGFSGFLKERAQLLKELVGQLSPGDILVVIHDARDVRCDKIIEFEAYQRRRF